MSSFGADSSRGRLDRFRTPASLLALLVLFGGWSATLASSQRCRTELVFPLRGPFRVVAGHAADEPHASERSQRFAYDVVNVTETGVVRHGRSEENEDWVGFGRTVVAPAAGTVIWARDGFPDNVPGEVPGVERYRAIADPYERRMAIAGNSVVIDHGTGEYSLLAHLAEGSVEVRAGDRVLQGQAIGRVGNSGNSTDPHLHYQLMNGPRLLEADGVPAVFVNVDARELVTGGVYLAR